MRRFAGRWAATLAAAALALLAALAPAPAMAAGTNTMYRLYNPNSGEHFYTASAKERDSVVAAGWRYEGVGWTAPAKSDTPVYRLYSGTDHHYTTSAAERDHLVSVGWKDEGIGWYSDDAKGVPLYRQFNPNVQPSAPRNNSGSHNYTTSKAENDHLVALGWRAEGIGWYGVRSGSGQSKPADPSRPADPTRPAANDPGPFADDAGEWTVWGTCEWRISGGTLYVRPTNAWNGEGTLGGPRITREWTEGEYYYQPHCVWQGTYTTVKSSGKIHLNADSRYLFGAQENLRDISALKTWDASAVTDLSDAFKWCQMTDLSALSTWDVSHVTTLDNTFCACNALTSLHGVENWNTRSVTNLRNTFGLCHELRDISALANWNTSNVTDMAYLFGNGSSSYVSPYFTNVDALANWDVSNVTDMEGMFFYCTRLQDVSGLAGWNVSNVTDMREMFGWCKAMTNASVLNGWNVSSSTKTTDVFLWAGSKASWYQGSMGGEG